jgi:hypothetical protein
MVFNSDTHYRYYLAVFYGRHEVGWLTGNGPQVIRIRSGKELAHASQSPYRMVGLIKVSLDSVDIDALGALDGIFKSIFGCP